MKHSEYELLLSEIAQNKNQICDLKMTICEIEQTTNKRSESGLPLVVDDVIQTPKVADAVKKAPAVAVDQVIQDKKKKNKKKK